MIHQIISLLAVYVAFVLEATGTGADQRGVEPRWLLLTAAYLAWTHRAAAAVLWGGVCGLLADALSGGYLGGSVAIFSVAVWTLGWLRRDRRWHSGVAFLLTTFAFIAACVVGTSALTSALSGVALPEWRKLILLAGGQGAMTALWGGGFWLVIRVFSGVVRRIVPPLDWRKAVG